MMFRRKVCKFTSGKLAPECNFKTPPQYTQKKTRPNLLWPFLLALDGHLFQKRLSTGDLPATRADIQQGIVSRDWKLHLEIRPTIMEICRIHIIIYYNYENLYYGN